MGEGQDWRQPVSEVHRINWRLIEEGDTFNLEISYLADDGQLRKRLWGPYGSWSELNLREFAREVRTFLLEDGFSSLEALAGDLERLLKELRELKARETEITVELIPDPETLNTGKVKVRAKVPKYGLLEVSATPLKKGGLLLEFYREGRLVVSGKADSAKLIRKLGRALGDEGLAERLIAEIMTKRAEIIELIHVGPPLTVEEALEILERENATLRLHPFIDWTEETGLLYGIVVPRNSDSNSQRGSLQHLWIGACTVYTWPSADFAKRCQQTPGSSCQHLYAPKYSINEAVRTVASRRHQVQVGRILQILHREGITGCKALSEGAGEHLLGTLKHYVWFPEDRAADYYIVAAWVLGTYLFPLFGAFPPLVVVGTREAGKSTLLQLLRHLVFNPPAKSFGLPTGAAFFRLIELLRPTLIVDEGQTLHPDVELIFELGFERGGAVPRSNRENPDDVRLFEVYCPKALASRVRPRFSPKAIVLPMVKAPKGLINAYSLRRRELEAEENPKLLDLSVKLMAWAIVNQGEVLAALEDLQPVGELSGRAFRKWAPILAIVDLLWPDAYESVVERAIELVKEDEAVDRMSLIEEAVLSVLLPRAKEADPGQGSTLLVTSKELRVAIEDFLGDRIRPTLIGSALDNLRLVKKRVKTSSGTKYWIDPNRVISRARERGIVEEAESPDDSTEEAEVWRCPLCEREFSSEDDLRRHLDLLHGGGGL